MVWAGNIVIAARTKRPPTDDRPPGAGKPRQAGGIYDPACPDWFGWIPLLQNSVGLG
jgi:hypothetical protein